MKQVRLHQFGNFFGLVVVCGILSMAFYYQLSSHELPCPLCLLQRVCFIAIGLCMAMNLLRGIKPSHYGLMILSSLLGFSIAMQQVFLHIAPTDTGYGPPVMGVHLYVWAAICFLIIIGFTAIALGFEQGFQSHKASNKYSFKLITALFSLIIFANTISTLLECGLTVCPPNPVKYQLIS